MAFFMADLFFLAAKIILANPDASGAKTPSLSCFTLRLRAFARQKTVNNKENPNALIQIKSQIHL